jgi:hypothetical protein
MTYLFCARGLAPAWADSVFFDINSGIAAIAHDRPDAVVLDPCSLPPCALRAVRRAYDGPLVVLGGGDIAAEAIEGGADDYAATVQEVGSVVDAAKRRHQRRQLGMALYAKVNRLAAMAGVGA